MGLVTLVSWAGGMEIVKFWQVIWCGVLSRVAPVSLLCSAVPPDDFASFCGDGDRQVLVGDVL